MIKMQCKNSRFLYIDNIHQIKTSNSKSNALSYKLKFDINSNRRKSIMSLYKKHIKKIEFIWMLDWVYPHYNYILSTIKNELGKLYCHGSTYFSKINRYIGNHRTIKVKEGTFDAIMYHQYTWNKDSSPCSPKLWPGKLANTSSLD